MALASYTYLFIACKIGEDFESSNQVLLEKFYTLHWYEMPAIYQKVIVQVIHSRQHVRVITMGPFRALNYEKSTQVRASKFGDHKFMTTL